MTITVLVERLAEEGYRATGGPPPGFSAEGATRDEALSRLREEIGRRLATGAALMPLEIEVPAENPWTRGAGMFRDNPLFPRWREAIDAHRREADEADEAP